MTESLDPMVPDAPAEEALGADKLEPHPLADIFPLLEGEQFDELVEDIRDGGLIEPIILYEGKVLDGRNRYHACLKADVEPAFKDYEGDSPLAFVISRNLRRRHLDTSQRAMVAARIATMKQGARTDLAQICAKSQEAAAEMLNVGRRSVQHAREVLDEGIPELAAKVDRGEVSVSAAARMVRAERVPKAHVVIKREIKPQKEQAAQEQEVDEVDTSEEAEEIAKRMPRNCLMAFNAGLRHSKTWCSAPELASLIKNISRIINRRDRLDVRYEEIKARIARDKLRNADGKVVKPTAGRKSRTGSGI